MRIVECTTSLNVKVLIDLLIVLKSHFKTLVLHLREVSIDIYAICTKITRNRLSFLEDITTYFTEYISIDAKVLEELEVDTGIELSCYFPCDT